MGDVKLWDGSRIPVGKIVCVSSNYEHHAREMGTTVPPMPQFFLKPNTSIIHDGGTVVWPPQSQRVDHEVELGVVVGKRTKDMDVDAWREHVLGYVVLLDMTARDLQKKAKERGGPWAESKGFDTFCPMSAVRSVRDVKDPHALKIELKINGEVRQSGSTGEMVYKIPELLAHVSRVMTLDRGDVVATGTPEGIGPVSNGDELVAVVDGVGSLTVRITKA